MYHFVLCGPSVAMAQDWKTDIPKEITTPDHVQSKLGDLDFKDGYPTQETANTVRYGLDYVHGVNAFMTSIQGVSLYAFRKGLADVGIKDGEFFYTSKMLDWKSLLAGGALDLPGGQAKGGSTKPTLSWKPFDPPDGSDPRRTIGNGFRNERFLLDFCRGTT
jgi:hypothetical protein